MNGKLSSSTARLCSVILVMAIAVSSAPVTAEEAPPSIGDVAVQLSDPETRNQTLYRLAATARLLQRAGRGDLAEPLASLKEDTQWLRRLESRYGASYQRSPVLDPAAWLIELELEQRGLPEEQLVSPAGPDLDVYLDQVFNRSEERLAAVILPVLLWQVEPLATDIWSRFLAALESDQDLAATFAAEPPAWFGEWAGAGQESAALSKETSPDAWLLALDRQVEAAVGLGPPDRREWANLRTAVLLNLPGLEGMARSDAISMMRLSDMVDGLHEKRYFAFAEGLLSLVAGLLENEQGEGEVSPLTAWLLKALPPISATYARAFASVDPRLNTAVAAAFDVVTELSRQQDGGQETLALRRELADAVAQAALLIPDLGYYFSLPVRDAIAGGMDACTGLMARREMDGSSAMTRDLYDDCQQTLVDLADNEARAAALAGDFDGPFGNEALQRELRVTSGQRINYGIGYLHERYSTGCEEPDRPLPNPLEWSALATLLAWFAEQSPIYFKTPENEARLKRMQVIGDELLRVVAAQVDCFAGAGTAVNDPVARTLVDYRAALLAVGSGISDAVKGFRASVLKPGADVSLKDDASQSTAYRPDDLMIGPCDPDNICEMSGKLASTRALLGLFPDEFLLADQVRRGSIEICYDEMSWVRRRSELVRADDTNVANYFGHLTFKLKGRYRYDDQVEDVFGFQFTAPQEQHYLFAANSEPVLQDACPTEWIGQRIITPLQEDHGGIVPNRLTYLAAPRMLPSRLLAANWDRGAEWRDWFITGIGVEELEIPPPADISQGLNQYLQALYRAEQAAIYDSLSRPPTRGSSPIVRSLYDEVTRLSTVKALLRQQLTLFYPQLLLESDLLRSAVAGQGGLLDQSILLRLRNENVPVGAINSLAFTRYEEVTREWAQEPELIRRTGSVASSLAHAMMRLNALNEAYFASPARALQVVPASRADPSGADG